MYFYLYDAFLRDKQYERVLARIEGRVLELGIQGKSAKLTILKSMREITEDALRRGADTIVVVGDDQTMNRVVGLLATSNVTLGMIPLGKETRLAEFLGIPHGVKACDVLSARITEQIDVGKANDTYFLSFLDVAPAKELLLECDEGNYHIEPFGGPHSVSVYNFGSAGRDPRDGILETVVRPHVQEQGLRFGKKRALRESVFPVRRVRIKSFGGSVAAYADGQTVVKTPVTVQVVPKKLRVIVGKNRRFA